MSRPAWEKWAQERSEEGRGAQEESASTRVPRVQLDEGLSLTWTKSSLARAVRGSKVVVHRTKRDRREAMNRKEAAWGSPGAPRPHTSGRIALTQESSRRLWSLVPI